MLITPMTPKVMARPIAASSSTDEAERPYQRSCAALQNMSWVRIEDKAASAAALTCGSAVFWSSELSRFCASWSPRALSASIADSRSAEVAWSLVATIAATASFSTPATRGSLSLPSWALSAGSALASRVRNTSPAAASRFSGSALASVSEPVAPWIAVRNALLTLTFLKASGLTTGAPVLASTTEPLAVR